MGLQVLTMGVVFGLIFETEIEDYLPFLAVSIVLWGLVSTTINEGCGAFSASGSMIKQLNLHHSVYILRTVIKNLFAAAHNFVIVPIVMFVFLKPSSWGLMAVIPGFILLTINLGWIVLLLAVVAARFRDLAPIVNSLTTVAFFVTPVMWSPDLIEKTASGQLLLDLNPLYHLLQIVRLPILGGLPTIENWTVAILIAAAGWMIALLVYLKYRKLIPYWI